METQVVSFPTAVEYMQSAGHPEWVLILPGQEGAIGHAYGLRYTTNSRRKTGGTVYV